MLTLDQLKAMVPGQIIASGVVPNSPEGVYMTNENSGKELLWIAKRGGIHDWAIYIHWKEKGFDYVLEQGDKVINPANVRKLVPCDDEAFKMYRK